MDEDLLGVEQNVHQQTDVISNRYTQIKLKQQFGCENQMHKYKKQLNKEEIIPLNH